MKYKNRREFYRYELNFPLWFEIEPKFEEPHCVKYNILNINQKGMCFDAKFHYDIGKLLGIRFALPGFEELVYAIFQIIWSKKIAHGNLYRIGGEFLYLKNADQEKFRLVAERYSKKIASVYLCPNCGHIGYHIKLNEEELKDLENIVGS